MKREAVRTAGPLLVGLVLGIVLWTNAGPLDPDPGPVAPTMTTLQAISDKIDSLQSSSCGCEWRSTAALVSNTPVLLAPGSGIVHGVWTAYGRDLNLYDGHPSQGGTWIGTFAWSLQGTDVLLVSEFYQLDTRYTNGLYATGTPVSTVTTLYRPDP